VATDRFRILSALPAQSGWRVELAIDREVVPPRAVELAHVPSEVGSDAEALAALLRGAELASRVAHPAIQPALGLVEVGGGLALASPFREGEPLQALLAAGGPLSPPLAVRVVAQVAAALQAVHRLVAAGDRPLVHGAVGPETVRIAEDGAVLLTGLGRPAGPGAVPGDDVAGLARLLEACLPELPAPLRQAVLDSIGEVGSAGALGQALSAVEPPATSSDLARALEKAMPQVLEGREDRRRALVQALRAEGGAPADETSEPAAVAGANPRVPPALTPPPIRPIRNTPVPPGPSMPPGLPAPSAGPPPAPSAEGQPPGWQVRTAMVEGSADRFAAPPARAAPGPEEWVADEAISLLDDDRWPGWVAAAAAAVGLALGYLLGR
jgi:serine/threonine-protein kinase